MPTKEEIEKVISWCEDIRVKKGRPAIERNPFTPENKLMLKIPHIFFFVFIFLQHEIIF